MASPLNRLTPYVMFNIYKIRLAENMSNLLPIVYKVLRDVFCERLKALVKPLFGSYQCSFSLQIYNRPDLHTASNPRKDFLSTI